MAIVNVSINDTIQAWVNDTNLIARNIGDLNQLTTTVDSDIVGALNSIQSTIGSVAALQTQIDSADTGFVSRARGSISVTDTGGDGSLVYNDSDGILTYTGPSAAEVRAHFSGGTGITLSTGTISITNGGVDTTQLADDAVDQTKLANVQTLIIYNSAGTPVKTLYGAGS